MATTPHAPPKHEASKHPAPPAPFDKQPSPADLPPSGYRPTIGVMGAPIEDGERDPDTIAEEQRRRSEEMERVGIDAYMKAHSAPVVEEEKKQVPGVAEHKR